jgi:hypothetical protein
MLMSKINFFQPAIWEDGALLEEVERNMDAADDLYASGQWKAAIDSRIFEKYKDTLGGKATESFDPDGYLSELELRPSLTAGRTNTDLLRAFHLIKEFRPDPSYFPLPKKIAARFQIFFLSISRISPHLANAVDRLVNFVAVKMIESSYKTDQWLRDPYGKFEEIIKGEQSDLPKETRYFGILHKNVPQFAWDQGPHTGSIDPDLRADENFGTYDIAVKFGFSEAQARRIAIQCYGVDESNTHYHDPRDRTKPRITGTVGQVGDLQRHYNFSPAGAEDTRIAAARIHLDRALKLAGLGFYDAAEREFSIGLHSLQDMFSHAQLTPNTHTCLGEFPDLVRYHPISMFETAVATEGYFKKFIAGLKLKPIEQIIDQQIALGSSDALVIGSANPQEKSRVSQKLAEFPKGLTVFLGKNGIRIFVGAESTRPNELGFGIDLDGNGWITPGKWVDINKDGHQQWFEVEDQFEDGKTWDQQPAAYNHQNRLIYIANRILKDADFEKALKHEINHAVDLTLHDDPQLKDKWRRYINKLYNTARRQGKIAFDESNPHEYFAEIEDS